MNWYVLRDFELDTSGGVYGKKGGVSRKKDVQRAPKQLSG
jgi:hypothetical protein